MKISEAINFCLQYQKVNSKKNTIKNYEFILGKFEYTFKGRGLGTFFDKNAIDEAILRTVHVRNRLMLEPMARGGMRVSEVFGSRPIDIQDRKLLLHEPRSGREQEVVFIPQKLYNRLVNYVRDRNIESYQRIFPITYAVYEKWSSKLARCWTSS